MIPSHFGDASRPMAGARLASVVSLMLLLVPHSLPAQPAESEVSGPDSVETAESIPVIPPRDAYGLDQVQDETDLTYEDSEVYYGLLHRAQQIPADELKAAGRAFVQQRREVSGLPPFPDMLKHPREWRGQPVYLSGHLQQTIEYPAAANPWGIETLYESALYTDDSQLHPITVVFTNKPDNLPVKEGLVDRVRVAGYFLKLYLYPSADQKIRKAPLILADTLTVLPTPDPGPLVPREWVIAFVIVLAVLAAIFVARIVMVDRARREQRHRETEPHERPDFSGLG